MFYEDGPVALCRKNSREAWTEVDGAGGRPPLGSTVRVRLGAVETGRAESPCLLEVGHEQREVRAVLERGGGS